MRKLLARGSLVVVSIGITLGVIEGVCGFLLQSGRTAHRDNFQDQMKPRPLLPGEIPSSLASTPRFLEKDYKRLPANQSDVVGEDNITENSSPLRLKPNFKGYNRLINPRTGFIVYDTQVETDAGGRRWARPRNENRISARHLILSGCSYVFGVGLPEEETIPWQMNQLQKDVEVYNLSRGGVGTSDILAWWLTGDPMVGVAQKRGILVYNFIAGHFLRALASSAVPWAGSLSDVERVGDHFQYRGLFDQTQPFQLRLKAWFAERNISRFFGLQWPALQTSHYELIADMILEMRSQYRSKSLPQNDLVVVIYPQFSKEIDIFQWRQMLSKKGIPFIDYSTADIAQLVDGQARIDFDGHPNGKANQVYAKLLVHDLQPFLSKP